MSYGQGGGGASPVMGGPIMHGVITEDDLKGIIASEVSDARQLVESSEVTVRRTRNLNYFYCRAFGDEVEGRSKAIVPDVRNSVEWMMPSLMKMFCSGQRLLEYRPTHPSEAEMAREVTAWANAELFSQAGVVTICKFLKACLIEGTQIGKVYAEDKITVVYETWNDVSLDVVAMKMQAGDLELTNLEPTEEEELKTVTAATTGQIYVPARYNVTVCRTAKSEKVCFHGVASENILVSRRYEIVDDDIPFIGELCEYSKSDLVAMGFNAEVVEDLEPNQPTTWRDSMDLSRYRDEGLNDTPRLTSTRSDWQSERVWLLEAYILVDEDGDGIAERRQIYAVGEDANTILSDNHFAGVPFFSADPIPMPHKLVGFSQADLTADWQRVDSAVLRNVLDHLYQTTNPRHAAVEDEVEIDDLLDNSPGAVVRVRKPGMIEPIVQQPLGGHVMAVVEWLQGQVDSTGVSKLFQGIDANSINETAGGMGMMMSAAQARVTLVGLMLTPAFQRMGVLLLRGAKQGGLRKKLMPYGESWVTIDPAIWNEHLGVKVRVGLGVGQQRERTEFLTAVAQFQQQAMAAGGMGYLVNGQNFFETARAFCETNGWDTPEDFFMDPHGQPPPPPPPQPEMIVAQAETAKAETDRENKKLRAELDAANNRMNYELQLKRMDLDFQLKLKEIESRETIALANVTARKDIAEENRAASTERAEIQAAAQKTAAVNGSGAKAA